MVLIACSFNGDRHAKLALPDLPRFEDASAGDIVRHGGEHREQQAGNRARTEPQRNDRLDGARGTWAADESSVLILKPACDDCSSARAAFARSRTDASSASLDLQAQGSSGRCPGVVHAREIDLDGRRNAGARQVGRRRFQPGVRCASSADHVALASVSYSDSSACTSRRRLTSSGDSRDSCATVWECDDRG